MKNNPLERIKLLMKYDLRKTLNENLGPQQIILEQSAELKAALDVAKTVEEKIPALSKFFKTSEETARAAFGRSLKDLEKDLIEAIKKDIKGEFRGVGTKLGPNASIVSKQMAMKEILDAKGVLSEVDIQNIINRIKNLNKQIALGKEVKAGERLLNARNKKEALINFQNELKNATTAEEKQIIQKIDETVKKTSDKKWSLFNDIKDKLKKKYWYYLGIAGVIGGGVALLKSFGLFRPDNDLFNNNCIDELIDNGSATVTYTTGGDPVIYVKNTGNEENDKAGGLNFFNNGRVVSRNKTKRGSWKCSDTGSGSGSNTMEVIREEDLEEQLKIDQQLNSDVDTMIDLLDTPVSQSDLKSANDLLMRYANNGKGKEFLQKYSNSGIGPGGIKTSLDYIYTIDETSVDYKNNLYKIIKQIESGGEEVADLGGIQITWDTGKPNQGGRTTPPKQTTPAQKYKDCSSIDINTTPLTYGCKDNRIAEMQGCIGVTADGKFGPNTLKALVDKGYEAANGITKEMYDKIIAACKKGESTGQMSDEDKARVQYLKTPLTVGGGENLTIPKYSSNTETNEDFYNRLAANGNFRAGAVGDNRVKYKGTDLNASDLSKLNDYMTSKGYRFIKSKDKGAQYDGGENDKYVWQKTE